MIVRASVVLNRTVVDSDWRFDNLCGSHLKSQSQLYRPVVIDLIGQLRHDVPGVIGREDTSSMCAGGAYRSL